MLFCHFNIERLVFQVLQKHRYLKPHKLVRVIDVRVLAARLKVFEVLVAFANPFHSFILYVYDEFIQLYRDTTMHRTFIAIPASQQLRSYIRSKQDQLKSLFSEGGFRFMNPDDAHLTISFLGDQTDEEVGETVSALTSIAPMLVLPEEVHFERITYWPNSENPSLIVLVADASSTEALSEVREDVENGLLAHEVKFRPDNRRFVAHITLARRTKESALLPELNEPVSVSLVPTSIDFYESHLGKDDSHYELLMSTPVESEV